MREKRPYAYARGGKHSQESEYLWHFPTSVKLIFRIRTNKLRQLHRQKTYHSGKVIVLKKYEHPHYITLYIGKMEVCRVDIIFLTLLKT